MIYIPNPETNQNLQWVLSGIQLEKAFVPTFVCLMSYATYLSTCASAEYEPASLAGLVVVVRSSWRSKGKRKEQAVQFQMALSDARAQK